MEYQPRSSTSERDFGPVTLFDNHLKYLNDSYLNFFTERFVRYHQRNPIGY